MKRFAVVVAVLAMVTVATPLFAQSAATRMESRFQEYFQDLVREVEQAKDPADKRAVLNEGLKRLLTAMDRIQRLPFLGREKREALAGFAAEVREKHDELNGAAGFAAVANADLDDFAVYMAQDLEQARTYYLALSGLAIVLIVILLIILL